MDAQYELQVEILDKLRRQYMGYKFYSHKYGKDFVQKKGILRKKTGLVIKASEIKWKPSTWGATAIHKSLTSVSTYKVTATVSYYVNHEHEIVLYEFE